MSETKQPSVAIIGAGPGGLASALLLAKSGVKVTVFERSAKVGGRNKVFERDGFKFDLGPTFFHYPEVIEDIFQAVGLDAHEELNLQKLDINYRLIFGQGGQLDCTSNVEQMVDRIEKLSGKKNAEGFRKYLEDNRMKEIVEYGDSQNVCVKKSFRNKETLSKDDLKIVQNEVQ